MAISCFTGKPGNGKTLTMMHFLAEDLFRTNRFIVTNIPVKLEELAEFIESETDRRNLKSIKLHERLLCIDTVEALMFWRFRPCGLILPKWDGKSGEGKVLPEEELLKASKKYWQRIGKHKGATTPVSYYISEAHRYYNAKRFAAISVIAELYATHHRHLHDEVYLDTQFPKQLCVAMRELIEEWHVLRNDYNRNVGFVKMIPRIRMSSYYEMPTGGALQKPFDKRSIFIKENGVAGCYESTGALGAIERAQDTEEQKKKKGIDLRVFVGACVLGVVLFFLALTLAPKYFFRLIFGGGAKTEQVQTVNEPTQNLLPAADPPPNSAFMERTLPTDSEGQEITLKTFSYYTVGVKQYFRGELNDGTLITHETEGFQAVHPEKKAVRINGVEIVHRPSLPIGVAAPVIQAPF
jgi:hypothetical protein